jgi:hypothetical protein
MVKSATLPLKNIIFAHKKIKSVRLYMRESAGHNYDIITASSC